MLAFLRRKIPSLEEVTGIYSQKEQDPGDYLRPKTTAQITDAIIKHFQQNPADLSGRTALLSLRNFIKLQDREGRHFEAVTLLCSVIKILPVESYFDGSSDSRSCARILGKFGARLSEQVKKEAELLSEDFDYEIRPRDGYRMQLTELPQQCYEKLRDMEMLLSGLCRDLNPDLGKILGIESAKLKNQSRKISKLADSMLTRIEKRNKDIRGQLEKTERSTSIA